MKKQSLKLELGKKSIASLKSAKNLEEIKGKGTIGVCASIQKEHICIPTAPNTVDLC